METLAPLATFVKSSIRNFGITCDSDFTFKSLVCSCFYYLSNIAKLSATVSGCELEIVIHAFILFCLSKTSLEPPKVVQNPAAGFLTLLSVADPDALAPHYVHGPS